MATVTGGHRFEISHKSGTPDDPNLCSADDIAAYMLIDSVAISTATSKAVSTVNAAAPDSTSISQARSQAVSAASIGSTADSKAVSVSGNTSVADSKAISVSGNTSIADSKAVSVSIAPSFLVGVAASQNTSAAASKAESVATNVNPLPAGRSVATLHDYNTNNATYNVLDFSLLAINTNVNDATSTIQNVLTAVGALPTGGEVFCPRGTYKITSQLAIPSNVRLRGDGNTQTIFQVTLAAGIPIYATGKTNIAVEGIGFQGTYAIGVSFQTCTFVAVRKCSFTGGTSPATGTLYAGGIHVYGCDDVEITDNYFVGNGYIGAGLSSDIQVNGNGAIADGSKRIRITGNKCMSVAVQTNIGCYDMSQSEIADNVCTGAKCGAGNNNGYGIMIYRTSTTTSIACRENRVAHNLIYAVGGSGIYLQSCVRGAVVGNTIQDWGAVQDDTVLAVGAVSLQNSVDCTAVGNTCSGGAKAGVVLGGIPCEGHTIAGNAINTVTGSGISLRAPLVRCTITGNTVKSPSTYGIGTLPVANPHSVADGVVTNLSATVTSATAGFVKNDEGTFITGTGITAGTYILAVVSTTQITLSQNATATNTGVTLAFGGITDCMITGNVVQAAGLRGIDIYGPYRSTITGNTITNSGGSGLCLITGSSNTVTGNVVFNGGTILTNTYTAIDLSGAEGTLLSGNNVGNDVNVGYATGISVPASCVKSVVIGNRAEGLLTAAYSVDPSAAAAILFAGNVDTTATLAQFFPIRQQGVLQGAAASVVQFLLGDSGTAGAVGTLWGGGDSYVAQNAKQSLTADSWHQNGAATSKLMILRVNGDIEFYHAASGTVDGTFAAFWGATPTMAIVAGGTLKLNGTTVATPTQLTGTLVTAAQGNVTSLGTLTGLTTGGTIRHTGTLAGFYNHAAVAQAAAITAPTAPSAGYVQAEATSMKTAVDAIRVALTNLGLTL